jgi:hypothetical protein
MKMENIVSCIVDTICCDMIGCVNTSKYDRNVDDRDFVFLGDEQ